MIIAAISCASLRTHAEPIVSEVEYLGSDSDRGGLNDYLKVTVDNLEELVDQATEARKGIILYIDEFPLNGIYSETTNLKNGSLLFYLERTEESAESWTAILGKPQFDKFVRKVSISVGLENAYPIDTLISVVGQEDKRIEFMAIRPYWFWPSFAAIALVTISIFIWGGKSEMLRDPGLTPLKDKKLPYSLAKCQMAFWFAIVLASFLFIWAVTGDYDSISDSVLVLLGISAATGLGVVVQNQNKEEGSKRTQKIKELSDQLDAANTPVEKQPIEEQLKAYVPTSEKLLKDILTDERGVSLHRFQMFVWTIVLAGIFIYEVYEKLAMPEFGATLLTLMGISSGTYIGFMIPESHSAEQSKV